MATTPPSSSSRLVEHSAGQPDRIGEEVTQRAVLKARAIFEITDSQIDLRMGAVEVVDAQSAKRRL